MKISIVIPIYNRADGLKKCIENILSQDYKNYELILVNDSSTDDSGKLCHKYADSYDNIIAVDNETNLGPGLTRNAGLDKATGDYVIFLDSDDKYDTHLLSIVAKELIKRKPDILVYSLWEEYYDKSGRLLYRYSHSLPSCYLHTSKDIHEYVVLLEEETMLGYPWNKAYNLDYLRKTGARFTDIAHVEDILFNIEAFENVTSLAVLEDKLYHYRNVADNRLTDKYLPEYFKLQKLRIRKFYAQQKRWGTLNSYALSVLSGEYFRWLLSAVERQVHADIPYKNIRYFLSHEYNSKLYAVLSKHLRAGAKLNLLYKPMLHRNVHLTITIAWAISLVKRKLPKVFSILKQNR